MTETEAAFLNEKLSELRKQRGKFKWRSEKWDRVHDRAIKVFTFPALKKVLNANIINSHRVTEMTVIKSSLSRQHCANKFTFTAEGWNIPHLHRWRVFKNGQKQPWQLNNHEDFSQSRSFWRVFFFFNTLRQTDNFLNPLRRRPCRPLSSLCCIRHVYFKVGHHQGRIWLS